MYSLSDKVWWFALLSRLFVLAVSILSNLVLTDHDADAFKSPEDPLDRAKSFGDTVVHHLLGGLVRWDAQYFLHIAKYGYTHENCLAFFPLFPLVVRAVAWFIYMFLGSLFSYSSVIIISAVLVNLIVFIKSAVILHKLSLTVLNNHDMAYKAAILYCINPASIFFTVPYSETFFALFSFYGMLQCVVTKGGEGFSINCGMLFGLSSIARSNGILNIGFIAYERLKHFTRHTLLDLRQKYHLIRSNSFLLIPFLIFPLVISAVTFLVTTSLSLIPFIAFQFYGYEKFCTIHTHNLPKFITAFAKAYRLKLPGSKLKKSATHWCNSSIPLAYSYVQHHYWDVGFLSYYNWKQIPNFLLATPLIMIILFCAHRFVKQHSRLCYSLGLSTYTPTNNPDNSKKKEDRSLYAPEMFVFVVHAVFLTVFCLLCVHVQVTTRLVASASPVLYWFAAYLFPGTGEVSSSSSIASRLEQIGGSKFTAQYQHDKQIETVSNLNSCWRVFILTSSNHSLQARLLKIYFLSYVIIGTALFSNFYPWT